MCKSRDNKTSLIKFFCLPNQSGSLIIFCVPVLYMKEVYTCTCRYVNGSLIKKPLKWSRRSPRGSGLKRSRRSLRGYSETTSSLSRWIGVCVCVCAWVDG